MQDLSLHILDVVENSITAEAQHIEIKIKEDLEKDSLVIEIKDDGKGMDPAILARATDPFVSTRKERRVGLGLSLFEQAAKMSNGDFSVDSRLGGGTRVRATFQHSHIDRKPLGNMANTLIALIAGNPQVDFLYLHRRNGLEFKLDTREMKAASGKQQMELLETVKKVRRMMEEWMAKISGSKRSQTS